MIPLLPRPYEGQLESESDSSVHGLGRASGTKTFTQRVPGLKSWAKFA